MKIMLKCVMRISDREAKKCSHADDTTLILSD